MTPLSTLVDAPAAVLARLATPRPVPGARATPLASAAEWDNRPSWDNWSNR